MFHNMLVTALTPLNTKTEINSWENQPFTTVWPEKLEKKTKDITRTIKKKPKRVRTAFTTEQIRTLETMFSRYKYINCDKRRELAKSLNIGEKCVKIWFQNRRMKEKRETSESSSDSSSESFDGETPSVSASPPVQVQSEPFTTAYCNEYYPEHYQLPSYYNNNEARLNMYGAQTHNVSTFCDDNNVYPTQYYPMNNSYQSVNGNDFHNYYGSEMGAFWPSHQNPYYNSL